GPAISTRATSSLAGSAATSACASARGLVRAVLAMSIAALVAKSPCSRVLGRSITKSGEGASAGIVPAARRASMPWFTRAWRRIFTGGRFFGLAALFTRSAARGGWPAGDRAAGAGPRPPPRLDHPARSHRHRLAVADHEMVQQAHLHQGQGLLE